MHVQTAVWLYTIKHILQKLYSSLLRDHQHTSGSKPRRTSHESPAGKDMGESHGFCMGPAGLELYCSAKIWQLIPAMEGSSWLLGQIQWKRKDDEIFYRTKKIDYLSQVWYHTPVIPTQEILRQEGDKFKVSCIGTPHLKPRKERRRREVWWADRLVIWKSGSTWGYLLTFRHWHPLPNLNIFSGGSPLGTHKPCACSVPCPVVPEWGDDSLHRYLPSLVYMIFAWEIHTQARWGPDAMKLSNKWETIFNKILLEIMKGYERIEVITNGTKLLSRPFGCIM